MDDCFGGNNCYNAIFDELFIYFFWGGVGAVGVEFLIKIENQTKF